MVDILKHVVALIINQKHVTRVVARLLQHNYWPKFEKLYIHKRSFSDLAATQGIELIWTVFNDFGKIEK